MTTLLAHGSSDGSSLAVTIAVAVGAAAAAGVPYVRNRLRERRQRSD